MKTNNDIKIDILNMLDSHKRKWTEIKDPNQDVTHENFIDNVILVLDWVIKDIEKMA